MPLIRSQKVTRGGIEIVFPNGDTFVLTNDQIAAKHSRLGTKKAVRGEVRDEIRAIASRFVNTDNVTIDYDESTGRVTQLLIATLDEEEAPRG